MSLAIALISPYDYCVPGGVNRHIQLLAQIYEKKGHIVHQFYPFSDPHQTTAKLHSVGKPIAIPINGSVARICLSPFDYTKRRIRSYLDTNHFDIFHIHEPFVPETNYMFLDRKNVCKVVTFHANNPDNLLYKLAGPILRGKIKGINSCIAVSPAAQRTIAPLLRDKPCEIIPNFIDIPRFFNAERLAKFNNERIRILFVGRKERRKGFVTLLTAFQKLAHKYTNVDLIVVGIAETIVDHPQIYWEGEVSNEELPGYYKSADIFCAPSLGGESFGIVLIEAMAAGCAVVASNIAGYNDVIEDNKNGLLTSPGDPEALKLVLQSLIEDRGRRLVLARNARQSCHQYSLETNAQQILSIYDKLVEERELSKYDYDESIADDQS